MRLVTFFFALCISAAAFAQSHDPGVWTVTGSVTPETSIRIDAASPGAPAQPAARQAPAGVLAIDTLQDHFLRSTNFFNYVYRDAQQNTFPVVGSNTLYLFCGQKFPMTGNARILGALLAVSVKRINGISDTMVVNVWPGNETTGLPAGQTLGFGRFLSDEPDTSTATRVFTLVEMEQEVNVTNAFVITVRTRRLSDNDDLFMIWSNAQGDGRGERRACYITVQDNNLISGDFAQLLNFSGAPADFDIMILAIIDGNISSADKPGAAIGGLEFRGIGPNPAGDVATVHLRMERSARVSFDLIDASGRLLGPVAERELAPGAHTVPLQVGHLASGTYYLRISHAGGAFATPLRIAR